MISVVNQTICTPLIRVQDRRRTFGSSLIRLIATETDTLKRSVVQLQRRKEKRLAQYTTKEIFG